MIIKKTAAIILTAGLLFANTALTRVQSLYALNPDPVSCAMADAGVALISNVMTGTVINPASTVGLYRTVASVGGSNMTGDIQYNFASIGFATSIGIFGASLMYVDYNTDKYYDNAGSEIGSAKTTDMEPLSRTLFR
jgi:glycerol uptake facilitator-like aquaporin